MKRSFSQAAIVSILLYGCTTWTLTKWLEKRLDSNCTKILQAILNRSWRRHPTKQQLYSYLPTITKTIQIRWTRHAGHCWRSRDELISDILLWTPSHGRAKAGRPAQTYIQQLCEDTGCSPEDLPKAMNDRERWRKRVRGIHADGMMRWWLDGYSMLWFYGISTIVGYLMSNPLYTYILNIYDLVGFYGISTIVGYLMPNPLYTYILNIYDLVWFGFMAHKLL